MLMILKSLMIYSYSMITGEWLSDPNSDCASYGSWLRKASATACSNAIARPSAQAA